MPQYTRKQFVYKDGGTITLDWAYATDSKDKKGEPSKD